MDKGSSYKDQAALAHVLQSSTAWREADYIACADQHEYAAPPRHDRHTAAKLRATQVAPAERIGRTGCIARA